MTSVHPASAQGSLPSASPIGLAPLQSGSYSAQPPQTQQSSSPSAAATTVNVGPASPSYAHSSPSAGTAWSPSAGSPHPQFAENVGARDSAVAIEVNKAPEGVPQAVSEEGQEKAKSDAAAEEARTGSWFKQNLAKVKGNLCGPLHMVDLVICAWVFFWMVVTGTTQSGVKYLWLIVFLCSYFGYLQWNWKCDTRLFLWNMMDVPAFEAYWKHLRAQVALITMKTESWHWERRVSHSTTYHAGGGSSTTTTVTYVRSVSHTEAMNFAYNHCMDLSLDVQGSDLSTNNATFVHLWKEWDMNTALTYANQLQQLKSRNQSRDTYMDTFEYLDVPDWRSRQGVFVDGQRPLLLHGWIFIVSCVFLLSWPMKIYTEFVAKKGGFTMSKRVTL